MDKILFRLRAYSLKQKLPFLLGYTAGAGTVVGLWFLWLEKMGSAGSFGDITWLFIALLAICATLLIRKLASALYLEPKRLKGHIGNLPEAERAELLSDYSEAREENGRFFLTRFLLSLSYGGGIIRYSIIDRITVYPKGLWIETNTRGVLLKTIKSEDKQALANRLIELTNKCNNAIKEEEL